MSSIHSERIQSTSIIAIVISIITVINMIFIMVTRPADVCLPFTVKVGDGVGRYVVATRDIKAGQVIMMIMMMAMINMARMMMTILTTIMMVMMIIMRMMVQVGEGVGR